MSLSSVCCDKTPSPNLLCSTLRVIPVLSLTALLERGEARAGGPAPFRHNPITSRREGDRLRSSLPDRHKNSAVIPNYNPSILISS